MIILFYSEQCNFCKKLLEYLDKNDIKKNINLINIDKLIKIPANISIVPTIIDSIIEAQFEGNKAFEFIINQKYFLHPTNNIDYWLTNIIPKPIIEDDLKAVERHNFGFATFENEKISENIIKKPPINIDKKTAALLRLRR